MQMAQQHGREWRNILENKVRQSKIFKLYCVSCICLNWQAFVNWQAFDQTEEKSFINEG